MPWTSKGELRRLQRELERAIKRAESAEESLAAERQAKDWLVLQLASRCVTKGGQYGLDYEVQPPQATQTASLRPYVRVPTPEDEAKREWYVKCYRDAGKSEEEAIALWEAEMRGDPVRYPYEDAEVEH